MSPSFQSIERAPLTSIASIEHFEGMTPYRSIQDFLCKFFNASNRGSVYVLIPVYSSQEVSCAPKLSGCLIHMVLTSASAQNHVLQSALAVSRPSLKDEIMKSLKNQNLKPSDWMLSFKLLKYLFLPFHRNLGPNQVMEGLALQAVRNCCAKKTWRS